MDNALNRQLQQLQEFPDYFEDYDDLQERINGHKDFPEWKEKYLETSEKFLGPKSLEYLKTIPAGKRLYFLANYARDLTVAASDVKKYFETFPGDAALLRQSFPTDLVTTTLEQGLLVIAAPYINTPEEMKDAKTSRHNPHHHTVLIAERKELAKYHLIEGIEEPDYEIYEYGKALSGYTQTMNKAVAIDSFQENNEVLDPSHIFDEKFNKLPPRRKARAIALFLADLQERLVFDETYNTVFTRESVNAENSRSRKMAQEGSSTRSFNVAHSMLYGTYQPSASYNNNQFVYENVMNSTAMRGGSVDEYPFERILLEVLGYCPNITEGKDDLTKTLIDFWDKNRNPIFANAVTKALNSLNAQLASKLLLEKIRKGEGDRTALAAILYRLEFGRIGISEEGVQYLERTYDLKELNNPDYYVQRLTSQGEIGVFNEDAELLKYFSVGDITDGQENITPEVLEFAYETFFLPKENETAEERKVREAFMEEFKKKYPDFADADIFTKNDVHLNNLSFREQAAFLFYLSRADEETREKLESFVEKFGEDGIKLFLVLNVTDEKFGEDIIHISERLSLEHTENILARLAKILSVFEELEERIKTSKLKGDASSILKKAREKVLERVFKSLSSLTDDQSDMAEVLKKISQMDAEAILFTSLLSASQKEDLGFSLEDISNTRLEHTNGDAISETDIEVMKGMYKRNYTGVSEDFIDALLVSFDKALKRNLEIVLVRDGDKLAAWCAFERQENGVVYFGKFNVAPEYQGSSLGEEIMREELDARSIGNVVEADCIRDAKVSSNYIERGFIGIAEETYPGNVELFKIFRNEHLNKQLNAKKYSTDVIKKLAKTGEFVALEKEGMIIYSCPQSEIRNVSFDKILQDNDSGNRMVLSRYVLERGSKNPQAYFVFEKVKKEFLDDYMGVKK